MRKLFIAFTALLSLVATTQAQIFADFQTSLGDFTVELNHAAAPKTVANFVSLAEGTRSWISPSGVIQENKPFYNGLIFHRVIAGFMNQGGCPLGTGSSGPGYAFPDETSNSLLHEGMVISMANSGADTNGSQFFITLGVPKTWLDGKHTVFGKVISGGPVVELINAVPTTDARPDTPVIIQTVNIRRVGAEALAFDVQAQNLPIVKQGIAGNLQIDPGVKVDFTPLNPWVSGSTTDIYRSADLTNWTLTYRYYHGLGTPDVSPFEIDRRASETVPLTDKAFYRIVEVEHPGAFSPRSFADKSLIATWDSGSQNMTFNFDSTGSHGEVIFAVGNTTFDVVEYTPKPYGIIECNIRTAAYGWLGLDLRFTGQNTTHILGTHSFYRYNGGWLYVGQGPFTVTK